MNFRNNIHFSIMHLYNKKFIFFISSVIMCVGIIVTFDIFCVYFSVYREVLETRDILGNDRGNLYKIENGYLNIDIPYYEKYRDFLISLRENYEVEIYEVTNMTMAESHYRQIKTNVQKKNDLEKVTFLC